MLYFLSQFTNVVSINTAVVFVRLHWFEKRFKNVAQEAMSWRASRSRSRTNTQDLEERGIEKEKKGVDGRNIVVLDKSGRRFGKDPDKQLQGKASSYHESSLSSSEERKNGGLIDGEELSPTDQPTLGARNITFAENLATPAKLASNGERTPQQLTAEQNIFILERQRNLGDNETLRIPGPRESDRGKDPETLREGSDPATSPENDGLDRHITFPSIEAPKTQPNTQDLTFLRTATARSQGTTSALERAPSAYRLRRGSGTFPNVARTNTSQTQVPPYLSWQPTIGRNSAFVDLTEEQREELGGIEYRSLKLLAVVLVGK